MPVLKSVLIRGMLSLQGDLINKMPLLQGDLISEITVFQGILIRYIYRCPYFQTSQLERYYTVIYIKKYIHIYVIYLYIYKTNTRDRCIELTL